MDDKVKVACSINRVQNTVLTLGKLAVGLSINSVSVLSEAFHSGLDLAAGADSFCGSPDISQAG